MIKKLVVFDSHPVQYRVPIWQAIEKKMPGSIHVVYASDCSVRGHNDKEFGQNIAWDDPMLDGYDYTILNCEKGEPLSGYESLTGEGVSEAMRKLKPDVILSTGMNYRYDKVVLREAGKHGVPVWLRCETQDEAIARSKMKGILRSLLYRYKYRQFARMFYIGELNRRHYRKHAVPEYKLSPALYATVDRFEGMSTGTKDELRKAGRQRAGVKDDAIVVGFSGKFIPKKDPIALINMLEYLPADVRSRMHLYFIGSGELEKELQQAAQRIEDLYNVQSTFTGFVNQSELSMHYLTLDVLVLPSRRMGETWGLVANEAMQAGCSVVVSNAAGCYANFIGWERFRIFKEADYANLASQVEDLSRFSRKYDWATAQLSPYTISAIAEALINKLEE